jgi:hypothetical protein
MSSVEKTMPQTAFTFHESLMPWYMPLSEWLFQNQKEDLDGVATASILFCQGKVLLIQRASNDSMPDRWYISTCV